MNMAGSIGKLSVFIDILFWFVVLGPLYPYPVWGSPYQSADHYWPMYNITNGILEDVEGAAHTVVYNGGKIVEMPQLGHALSLDGKDDWVDTGRSRHCSSVPSDKFGCGFNADCVTEPSTCKEGFTMTFWLKVYSSGYIMSSGSFTNHRNGPGYQLYYHQALKRFKFLLETRLKRWTLLIHEDIGLWTHMAFTWRDRSGLRYYEDGNLSMFTDKPEFVSPLRQQNYTPVITLARPSNLLRFKEFGKFEISQFAIWLKELSADDIAGVYRDGVSYDQKFVLCCHFKSVSPCVTDPCHDAEQCRRISKITEKECICPNVNLRLETCKERITGECEDKSSGCSEFAAQSYYCRHRKMREICPRSCSYCASARPSTTLQPILSTGSTSMSRIVRESKNPVTVFPSSSPSTSKKTTSAKPTLITYGTTRRRMPRGESCEVLQCQYHALCFQTKKGDAECRCPHTCHTDRNPVCGTNGKTYLNMCVLRLESCQLGQWIDRKAHGFCGERFKLATHYLPMNGTTAGKKLIDLRGNVSSQAHNGIKESSTEQIDQVLTLDGKDDFIELKGVRDRCIVDPTDCTEGLSVAFWIKYTKGEFIISSGGYATGEFGPGFRFICQSCNKNRGPHAQSSGTFLLELSTATAKWKILLDSIPRWWFHFSFTWNRNRGLKFYKNGKLAVVSGNPEEISRYRGAVADLLTIGKPNSLKSMFRPNSYGAFSIGHFVIWTYELLSFDVEIAFMSVLTKSTNSMICCKKMKDDPCVKNPCHDGATCQRMEDKYKCICTDINNNMDCSSEQKLAEPCLDKSDRCAALANQEGYCDYHWRRMKALCPKACKYCASQKRTEPHTTASHQKTLVPNPSPGSQNMQTPVSTSVVPTTAVLGRLEEGDNKGLSRNVLILIICAGSGGLLLLIVVLAFIFTRFYKQRKGEFVPDKTYPNCQHKQNGEASVEDVDNISSFIDPSTPRITDVPHKPTRAQGSAGGAGGGGKKQKKPMGVKVTYKPPEWD